MADLFGYEEPKHKFQTFVCMGCGSTITIPISCGNRFCSVCGGHRRRIIRDRVDHLMNSVSLSKGNTFKFLTLTIPNMDDAKDQLLVLQKSFRRLRQRVWWKGVVHGGCSFYEVKKGKDNRYHIHLHCIIESSFVDLKALTEHWKQVSPGQILDIRMISKPAVIHYVTKYTTKSDLSLSDQLHASSVLKGSRLFQPFGSWHSISKQYEAKKCECKECQTSHWLFWADGKSLYEVLPDEKFTDPIRTKGKAIIDQLTLDIMNVSIGDFDLSCRKGFRISNRKSVISDQKKQKRLLMVSEQYNER